MTSEKTIEGTSGARSHGVLAKKAVACALTAAIAACGASAALCGCSGQDDADNSAKEEQVAQEGTAWMRATEGAACILRLEDRKTHDAYNYPLIQDTDAHVGPAAQYAVTWSDGRACVDLGDGAQSWQGEDAETKRYALTWHTTDDYTELGGLKAAQPDDSDR